MARCGRCGLWNEYSSSHKEKEYAGVCMWYQLRLREGDVWQNRECPDFFERIPGLHSMGHFDYKIKRDNLGEAWQAAQFSKKLAWFGVGTSLISLTLALWSYLSG